MAGESDVNRSTTLNRYAGRLRPVAFYATVLVLLALMVVFLGDTLVFVLTAWMVSEPGVHHLHELALVAMLWAVLVGLLVQVYKPERRVAAIQQALLVNIVITGANVLTGFLFPPALLLGGLLVAVFVLHPAGRDVFRIQTSGPTSPVLVGLVILAAIPLAFYAVEQWELQASGDVHAQLGHYADMVTYSLLVLLLGFLASVKPVGWRVPLWSAGGLAAVLGATSIQLPSVASGAGTLWGGLALLWAVGFVAAGEASQYLGDAANQEDSV